MKNLLNKLNVRLFIVTLLALGSAAYLFAGVQINGALPTYDTIQDALNNALDGDTLIVSTGTYVKTVDVFNRNITIDGGYNGDYATKAASGYSYIEATALNPGSVIDITNSTVLFIDLTLQNGSFSASMLTGFGAGLDVRGGSFVNVENCQIQDNICKGLGGGVYVENSFLVLSNSVVVGNTANSGLGISKGGGLYVENGNVSLIGMSVIKENYANDGGGVATYNSVFNLKSNSDIYENIALKKGGGILLENNSIALFTDPFSVIGASNGKQNSVTNGNGGGLFASDSSIVLSNSSRFLHNFASGDGGGAYLTNSSLTIATDASIGVTLDSCTNYAGGNGGGIFAANSTLNLKDSTEILSAYAESNGGGIFAENSTILFDNSTLGNSDAAYGNMAADAGGGLFAVNCSSVFENAEVLNNKTFSFFAAGGGMNFFGSNYFLAANTRFCGNFSDYGGAIYFNNAIGNITIDSCSITNNKTNARGGGIMGYDYTSLKICGNSEISYNSAAHYGGGIYLLDNASVDISSKTLSPVIISDNTAFEGGGIYGKDECSVSASGNIWLRRNKAQNGGGIYIEEASSIVMSNSSFFIPRLFGNEAAENGGGIFLSGLNSSANLKNVVIGGENVGNVSRAPYAGDGGGGGIAAFDGAKLETVNCVVQENFAANSGGGILIRTGAELSMISDFNGPNLSFIYNNFCTNAGGGIYANCASKVTMKDTFVVSNRTINGGVGGIILSYTTNSLLINNVIAQNDGGYADGADGVFFFHCPESILLQCTIADNDRIGIKNTSAFPVYMTNCIVYGHSVSQIWPNAEINTTFSDVQNGYSGTGNIDADPLFVDPDTFNYQLLDGSPCENTGVSLASVTNDCIGTFRPQNTDWDMGAFEFIPEPFLFINYYLLFIIYFLKRKG